MDGILLYLIVVNDKWCETRPCHEARENTAEPGGALMYQMDQQYQWYQSLIYIIYRN